MHGLSEADLGLILLALAVLIGAARVLGEIARRFQQPAVLGELLAGVVLGPTVLGTLLPEWHHALFPGDGAKAVVLEGIGFLAIVLFLLVAGIEVDLSTVWRQGRSALKVGILGTVAPFLIGLGGAWLIPEALGATPDADRTVFALFLATALSISALPIIAKTLMDLNLYRTDVGMVVVSAAIFNDLIGWTVFALILGMIGGQGTGWGICGTMVLTLAFLAVTLTAGRWLIHRALPILQAYAHWPAGVLGFVVTLGLLGGAFMQSIGVHAIFGAFIVGIAVGESSHLHERTRTLLEEFVSFIFAPVFFASIGLRVNFVTNFDLPLVAMILVLACVGKVAGVVVGALWGGLPARQSWAVGFAMNARGAMEIILGLLALEAGIISERLFVALVVMAIVTSAVSGPLMSWVLQQRQTFRLASVLSSKLFVRNLAATSRHEAIDELVTLACQHVAVDPVRISRLVWEREMVAATGIGSGIALPHARVDGLKNAVVAIGLSEAGVDFDAPDGQPAHAIFLLLTPQDAPTVQLTISAKIASIFRDPQALPRVMRAGSYTEFLAALKILEPQ